MKVIITLKKEDIVTSNMGLHFFIIGEFVSINLDPEAALELHKDLGEYIKGSNLHNTE